MKIPRILTNKIINKLKTTNKIVLLYGARQVGKTTLAKDIITDLKMKTLIANADEKKYNDILSSRDLDRLKALISGYDLLFLDEAQRIPDIGLNLKILKDNIPELKIIATGSSSFDLANKVSEPLTGRSWTYNLFPISFSELRSLYNDFELNNKLEEILIYGAYPEIITTINYTDKQKLLEEICRSYLYKDVLELATVKHSEKLHDLLKLIAFQTGSEVSITELGNSLNLSHEAIERYIDLLEKAFVIFRLKGFSRNLRKEVAKMDKIFFYDLGIRNAVIDNFKPIKDRNDTGSLWENFLIIERIKKLSYNEIFSSWYFWRTYTGAEIDYIEEREGNLYGYEFKFNTTDKIKIPKTWLGTYNNSKFELINKNNYLSFIT